MSSPRSISSSSKGRSSPKGISNSPGNKELVPANEVAADENALEQLGRNIVEFINTSIETGQNKTAELATYVQNKIDEYKNSLLINQMTPVEKTFNRQIKENPSKKKELELKKLKKDTYFTFHHENRYLSTNEKKELKNKVDLVSSAVEYHYDKIENRLNQLQRFRVIHNAMSAAIKYIENNDKDFLGNINFEYKDNVKKEVQDAIISAQFKNTAGRKKSKKRRPRYLRTPRRSKHPRDSRRPRRSRKPRRN